MKAEKRKKVNVHLKIDAEIWKNTVAIVDEMGFNNSGFVEFMLKQFIQAETVPFAQVVGDVFQGIIETQQRAKKKARS
jgi:antitoxin component of RelBE/YafQ-DinJ toxin-antitoxin module